MVRCNNQKSALIIAAIVILLCLVSITGATLALFTYDGEDGKIGVNITSGKLEVDIVDASPDNPTSLVGDVLNFVSVSDENEVLFEPGATYYTEGFRVKNNGSIPIDFIIYISEDETFNSDFNEAFEVWITKDPHQRDSLVPIRAFDGELEVGQSSEIYYLVFRMKTSAGNEFQNRTFTGVGITVCAVQGNAK